MIRTYLDSGVLIAAARGKEDLATAALNVLSDPQRIFLTSVFVQLEVLPKPFFNKYDVEVQFYETYFAAVTSWANVEIVPSALTLAKRYGLSALDALHVAAAIELKADELATTEGVTKPMHRVTEIKVVNI